MGKGLGKCYRKGMTLLEPSQMRKRLSSCS